MVAKKKRPRKPNYSRQAKLLVAMCYVIHGSINKAAKACGVPQRTAASWTKKNDWDGILREAEAQHSKFINSDEADKVWNQLTDMIDKVATLAGASAFTHLKRINQRLVDDKKALLTDKEADLCAKLFGIAIDKSMAIRGVGKGTSDGGAFDRFMENLEIRIASTVIEDPVALKKTIDIIKAGGTDGHGNGDKSGTGAVDINALVPFPTTIPKRPKD